MSVQVITFKRYQRSSGLLDTPSSLLSAHAILAVLQPGGADERLWPDKMLFTKLGILLSMTLKVKEKAANEHSVISHPAQCRRF
ncbi:hypothetical protein HD554DRAFT_2060808 [Boletus coccyginus]|nr:hypothetical protein HD554DRAFT_2060808 [Boletus coccyginus]